jgi:death-on-curing protein
VNSAVSSLLAMKTWQTLDLSNIFEKAALIAQRIIVGHIFHDGNKRTGMESCRLFLEMNGYDMRVDQEVVNTAIQIATHEIQFNEIISWLQERTQQRGIREP